jgi:pyridoxine/pyridoxamine 5'-phosphate oxidase
MDMGRGASRWGPQLLGRDGRPARLAGMGLWQDGGFLFSCGSRSRKARALAADPRIVVHLESGDEVVVVEGVAEPTTATERDVEAYEAKYDHRPSAGEGWYRVLPRRALAWREADYPLSATRFDF